MMNFYVSKLLLNSIVIVIIEEFFVPVHQSTLPINSYGYTPTGVEDLSWRHCKRLLRIKTNKVKENSLHTPALVNIPLQPTPLLVTIESRFSNTLFSTQLSSIIISILVFSITRFRPSPGRSSTSIQSNSSIWRAAFSVWNISCIIISKGVFGARWSKVVRNPRLRPKGTMRQMEVNL